MARTRCGKSYRFGDNHSSRTAAHGRSRRPRLGPTKLRKSREPQASLHCASTSPLASFPPPNSSKASQVPGLGPRRPADEMPTVLFRRGGCFGWRNKHSSARAGSGGCLGWSRLLRDLCASKNVLRPERHGFPLSPLRQIPIPARSRDAITPKITDQNANRKCNSSPDRRVQNHAQPPIGIVPLRPGRFNMASPISMPCTPAGTMMGSFPGLALGLRGQAIASLLEASS